MKIILSIFLIFNPHQLISAQNINKEIYKLIGRRILFYTNLFREQHKLNKLIWNEELYKIAQIHSIKIAQKIAPFSHKNFNVRINKIPFKFYVVGENLFKGYYKNLEKMVVECWKKSNSHRNALLSDFNVCAIGISRDSLGYFYICQLLAKKFNE